MSDKPLMDYTLAEVKEICKKGDCKPCPFDKDRTLGSFCPFWNVNPCQWDFFRITENEEQLLRLTGAKFVSRGKGYVVNQSMVALWKDKPVQRASCDKGLITWTTSAGNPAFGCLSSDLFPSIPPGVCLNVFEFLGKEAQTDG